MPAPARIFFFSQLAQIDENELVQIHHACMDSHSKIDQLLELISQLTLEEKSQLLTRMAESQSDLSVQIENQSHSSHTIFQINLMSDQKSDAVVDAIAKRIIESPTSTPSSE